MIKLPATNPQATNAALVGKNIGTNTVTTARRAVQGIRGIKRMVNKRARLDSMIRVPNTAGTLQPNPKSVGIMA